MQVDSMFSAEDVITIKQTKKRRGVHLYNERVIQHCLIMAQRQRLETFFQKQRHKWTGKGKQDRERRKNMINEHSKLLTMPRTIFIYKNYKNKL